MESTTIRPAHLNAPRLLFYAVNGLGLGHVTRMLAIAREVRRQRPSAQMLFISTSEADHVIYEEGFASVKVPSRSAIARTGIWPKVYNKLAQSVVMNTAASFNPAILVVDTFPFGASHELLSSLTWEMRRAFIFRAQLPERMSEPLFQQALSAYDLCIVPHPPASETLQIPEGVATEWTGEIFIRSKTEALTKAEARQALGLPERGRVLYVTFGGGGEEEIQRVLKVALEAACDTDWIVALADAPLQSRHTREALPKNVTTIRHYPMAECFNAFDAAISAGGYNTVAELIHFGIPSIIIPFPRGLDDQYARVRRCAERGAILAGELDVKNLQEQLRSLTHLATAKKLSQTAQELIPENGASRAAAAILGLL